MRIQIEIPSEYVANLMCSAIEGGDPVTTARKGGWCTGIEPAGSTKKDAEKLRAEGKWWYSEASTFEDGFLFDVSELLDESKAWDAPGNIKVHRLNGAGVRAGLAKMATLFPKSFAQILSDNIDAPCADAFLQACCFGEEKYA